MTVSIRRMSLGAGFEYLMRSVARSDGVQNAATALTRYYAETGTPPGRFLGRGLAGLDQGRGVEASSVVSEEALWRLLGMVADPVTGEPLGNRPKSWPTPLAERIRDRIDALPATLDRADREARVAAIEVEETLREKTITRPVAGFDLTFSVPKSVSALWALADPDVQAAIYQAHRDAIAVAIGWAEDNVLFSRIGRNGVVQEEIRGVVAAAFDHWDSRAGDPHLHTHVVIANRAQTNDGQWRSLDSRTLFRYIVALSELHEGVVHDLLTERLGLGWDERPRRHSPVPRHDITGVPNDLIETFSQRSLDIDRAKTTLIGEFATKRGRQPTTAEVLRIRQQATLETRPDKSHRSLRDMTADWRRRAAPFIGDDSDAWSRRLLDQTELPAFQATDIDPRMLDVVATVALDHVSARRATFGHANMLAEVHRQLHGVRFASPLDRLTIAARTTSLALEGAMPLTPRPEGPIPEHLQRPDGTSKLQNRGSDVYTTHQIMKAETRLIAAGRDISGPTLIDVELADDQRPLSADQRAAVSSIAESGRVLDVLVGPAGTGKTTSLAALRQAWEQTFGPGSVIGLAPSATAAEVLSDELAIPTENTAKWLHETTRNADRDRQIAALITQRTAGGNRGTVRARRIDAQRRALEAERDRWSLHCGQLVIIDEASLAGTLDLDSLTRSAAAAGAKILLTGDWAQLSGIDAGGAFALLATDRPDAPTLTEVHRFTHEWERHASTRLRVGDTTVVDTYLQHDRIQEADIRDRLLDNLYIAWRADTAHGLASLMIAGDRDTANQLNARAQADHLQMLPAGAPTAAIADGNIVAIGDRITTRRNDRTLRTGTSWVKNGDAWIVTGIRNNGDLIAQRDGGKAAIILPAEYVHQHVELGYATTTYRAQGRTVDTAHAIIDSRASRQDLYVAATRARHTNRIYVDTSYHRDAETGHDETPSRTAADVLSHVVKRCAGATSAHAAQLSETARVAELRMAEHKDSGARDPALSSNQPLHLAPDQSSRRQDLNL